FSAGLEQERNVEHRHLLAARLGLGEKTPLGLLHQGMNDRLESLQRRAITQNARSQLVAIDLAAGGGAGERRFDRRRGLPLVAAMHHRVGVVHRHALLGEKARRHRLSHSQRAGQTENEHASPNNQNARQFTPPAIPPAAYIAAAPPAAARESQSDRLRCARTAGCRPAPAGSRRRSRSPPPPWHRDRLRGSWLKRRAW